MSGSDEQRKLSDRSTDRRAPNNSGLKQNFGASHQHSYGPSTNADTRHSSSVSASQQPHLGESVHTASSRRLAQQVPDSGGRDAQGNRSPNGNPLPSSGGGYGTNSSSAHSTSSRSSYASRNTRPSTGPVKVPPRGSNAALKERSVSVESESGRMSLHFEGGGKGMMRDVEDDNVLVSLSDVKTNVHGVGSESSEARSSVPPAPKTGSAGGEDNVPSSATELAEEMSKKGKDRDSLKRQGSGERLNSGHGVYRQPESTDNESQDKVLTGEDSIKYYEFSRKLSRASSSGSSFDKLPSSRRRDDSIGELQMKHEEEMMKMTESLSVADKMAEGLKKEKEKLERKLLEAETVAHQAENAGTEISRLEAELKREKDDKAKILRARSCSPDQAGGAMLSEELDIVKSKLAWEVESKAALEQEMTSLKQSLVVSGKKDIVRRNAVMVELQKEVVELKETVRHLQKTLSEKEVDMKRQTQIQSRAIADLQSKLSKERQLREEIRKSVGTRARPSEAAGSDTAALTAALHEKERVIQQQAQQLQQFEKTARDVARITVHSTQQSEMIVNLRKDLDKAKVLLDQKEAALKASSEELKGMKTQYNSLRMKNTEIAEHSQQAKQLSDEVEGLKRQVAELRSAVEDGRARRTELQQSLERSEKECNHWKQKSVQQDMVLQTTRQDVDRLHREVNGLNSTVAAQGKEVETLQKENTTLQGEIQTHQITADVYKEDFKTEREDRQAAHAKIAEVETQYRHQLGSLAEQLQRKTEEAQRHKETLANTQQLLQRQQQQMTTQLQQKEEEMNTMHAQTQQLQEDVMSKTQQVKQYKKQIDQLTTETATYREQAEVHKSQIEFFAQKTEDYGRWRTLKELQERKILQLETQCDRLRAENNELRMKMDKMQSSGGGVDHSKAKLRGVSNPDMMSALPNPHPQGRIVNMGRSLEDEHLLNRVGGPSTHHQSNRTLPPTPQHLQRTPPYSTPGVKDHNVALHQHSRPPPVGGAAGGYRPEHMAPPPRQGVVGGQYNSSSNYHPQLQRQDSPYSSLPAHGSGGFAPQPQPRPPVYAHDDSSALYSPAGDVVDKDSPPSSTVGQGPQQLHPGQQRRAHSHMLSMASSGNVQRYPPSQHVRSPTHGTHQPPNSHIYHNLPNVPPNTGRDGSQYLGAQRKSPVSVSGQPSPQAALLARPPHPQGTSAVSRDNQYSTPVEESRRRRQSGKPPLEGYIKPQQASSHPIASQNLAVQLPAGRPENRLSPSHHPAGKPAHNPRHGTVSPSPGGGDISKDIDGIIEETASKVRAAEQVVEGEDSEGIPYDPNLVCPKCTMKFREGEIQKYRRHVSSAH